MDVIIGYTGLIGSYLRRFFPQSLMVRSTSIEDIRGRHFRNVWCAGASAEKWKANQDPESDRAALEKLWSPLSTITCEKIFLFSTIDVYSNPEVLDLCGVHHQAYGRHRRELEERILQKWPQATVVRLPALFGVGLKKNVIFDWLHGAVVPLSRTGAFQWYSLAWLSADLEGLGPGEHNLFPEPLENKDLGSLLESLRPGSVRWTDVGPRYALGPWWRPVTHVINALRRFLQLRPVGVTNLAGCTSRYAKVHEVAPYKFFGPDFLDRPHTDFAANRGQFVAFQGLFYPHDWKLFQGDYDSILAYTLRLVDFAAYLEVKILVFGAPKLRYMTEPETQADLFVRWARTVSDHIGDRSVTLCLEPNARHYGANFLVTPAETAQMVQRIGRSNVRLMLDTGCLYLENIPFHEAWSVFGSLVAHVHFSAPDLQPLSKWDGYLRYARLLQLLRSSTYTGAITLEMLNVSEMELEDAVACVLVEPTFRILGAGWLGCHSAATLLALGYPVSVYDSAPAPLSQTSTFNQSRLHQGFHYPRSQQTRQLCQQGFHRFMRDYGFLTLALEANIYAVAVDSILDAGTYRSILEHEGLVFEEVSAPELQNVTWTLAVAERYIHAQFASAYWSKRLERYGHWQTHVQAWSDLPRQYPYSSVILDCTNGALRPHDRVFGDCYTLSVVYESPHPLRAITVMDGPFWSLYPFQPERGWITLTHVQHGVLPVDHGLPCYKLLPTDEPTLLKTIADMEAAVRDIYPSFALHCIGSFIARKAKLKRRDDSRHLVTLVSDAGYSVTCGKITGIYDLEEQLSRDWQ